MRFLAFLILISAIAIAGCAAYFSIIGLKLLFVGSGVSIVVMGIALEVGKFITATFLKQKWDEISFLLKTYLIAATIILMAITSIGIYGYLSAGYNATAIKVQGYEQTIESNLRKIEGLKQENVKLAADPTNQSEIELINANKNKFVEQQIKLIEQKELRIKELQSNSNADKKSSNDLAAAKASLDADKTTLDSEINKELEQIKIINSRVAILDEEVQSWLKQGNRGLFRENGADKARTVKQAQEKERAAIDQQIKEIQDRIQNLRNEYKTQTDKYNSRVAAIEERLVNQNKAVEQQIKDIEKEIVSIRQGIDTYNANAEKTLGEQLTKKEEAVQANKANAINNETTIKELLAENTNLKEQIIRTDVGTFKFVANSLGLTLDKTVTYFIGAIILVFDPLAVCLILCFNHLIKDLPRRKKIEVTPEPTPTPVNIDLPVYSTSAPSTPETESMKSSEIIFGQKQPKPKHPLTPEGEAKRLADILEQQRQEKANRHAKKEQS
jgi:hypothetical protein